MKQCIEESWKEFRKLPFVDLLLVAAIPLNIVFTIPGPAGP